MLFENIIISGDTEQQSSTVWNHLNYDTPKLECYEAQGNGGEED